ncbi:AAA family ATPase [Spirochaetota bacterium]
MRVLKLRFKNLNSIVGEWQIDLEHPDYMSSGIFAITGPTGSGKSTILDAICLALYGSTPRLGKITSSSNEIMSRHTAECFTELVFETAGGRFRCHWSQHRARRKADGELQQARHEISNADTGEILESKITSVAEKIEAVCGMNFERFTRSMLLAQGDFAVFLQAAPAERAPILEQITGTDIYSQISVRVHEQLRQERGKLERIEEQIAGIIILEPEQEKETESELGLKVQKEAQLALQQASTSKAIQWQTLLAGLKAELLGLAAEFDALVAELDAFKPDQDKLDLALLAAGLDGPHAALVTIRRQQAADTKALQSKEEELPALEAYFKLLAAEHEKAVKHKQEAKKMLEDGLPVIRQTSLLDQKLAGQQEQIAEQESACQKADERILAEKASLLNEHKKLAKLKEKLDALIAYLEKHAADEWLTSAFSGMEQQLNSLLALQKEVQHKNDDIKTAAEKLDRVEKELLQKREQTGSQKEAQERVLDLLAQCKEKMGLLLGERALSEYRIEKDGLLRELALHAVIASLAEHRSKLEDGKACPLCGATEHPYASANIPLPDKTESRIAVLASLISQADKLEAAIKSHEESLRLEQSNLSTAEKQEMEAYNRLEAAKKNHSDLLGSLAELEKTFSGLWQDVLGKLKPLGIACSQECDISSMQQELKTRLDKWQSESNARLETEKELAAINSSIKSMEAVILSQGEELKQRQTELEKTRSEHFACKRERVGLFGDKDTKKEEDSLNKSVLDAEKAEQDQAELLKKQQNSLNNAKASIELLKAQLDGRKAELEALNASFLAELDKSGFADEEQFLIARLEPGQRAGLESKKRQLLERQTRLKARLEDKKAQLAIEQAKMLADQPLAELEGLFANQEQSLKELQADIASLNYKLTENKNAKGQIMERQSELEAQKTLCRRWQALHELIGSADGKKYRNFAQGLSFELMVDQANRQLQKMSERYLLVLDPEQPLELKVMDNYQAGEIRSTKNLSGGESFIVSLALALGLSRMASRKVRVDSLFLDEGFGSLDDEVLDTALESLASLQQDGKLIGVISHVPALKERIGTQIRIVPQSGGKSLVSGPGCKSLDTIKEKRPCP